MMNRLRTYAYALLLGFLCVTFTDKVDADTATRASQEKKYDPTAPVVAVWPDTVAGADSLLLRLKHGMAEAANDRPGNAAAELEYVYRNCPVLAPIALEQLGDMAAADGNDGKALASYALALDAQNLTARYRNHLFAKIRRATDKNTAIPAGHAWLADYDKWRDVQRMRTAAGLESVCDSLIRAGRIAAADSVIEQHLPGLGRGEACGFIKRNFDRRAANPARLTTRYLLSIAAQANTCRDFALAERAFNLAKERADFANAAHARRALLVEANTALGREQWSKAIELYKKFDTAHGPDSGVIANAVRASRRLKNDAEVNRWNDRHMQHFPNDSRTQDILMQRAWALEERGNFKAAAALYRRAFNTTGRRTEEAHVRHALCYYKQKAYDSVVVHIDTFVAKHPASSHTLSGIFWQGKALSARGKRDEARKVFERVAKLDPADYYGHRARQIIGRADSANAMCPSTAITVEMTEAEAREWLDRASPEEKKVLTPEDSIDLRRGAALLAIKRTDLAHMFLDRFENNYFGNLRLQYELAKGYAAAGDHARSFNAARRLNWRIPLGERYQIPVQVISLMYPAYYSMEIGENAALYNVDPLFAASVMRQESIFNRQIVSHAGAIGLMQVMPATGRTIARELKVTYAPDSLFIPAYGIRFGIYYMRKRLTQFREDPVLTLCAYNAGSGNAIRWRDRSKHTDRDLFIEDIPFLETRGYVKKVMGNYWTYRALMSAPGYHYKLPKPPEEYKWMNVGGW